jgi:hypothetical protein
MKIRKKVLMAGIVGTLLIVSIPIASYASTGNKLFKNPIDILMGSKDAYDKLPKEKKDEIDKEAKHLEQARAGIIKQAPKNDVRPQKEKQAPFDSGIMDKEAPPGVNDIMVSNIWRGTLGNQKISLYAGVKVDDAEQGAVVLDIMDENNKTIVFKELNTPDKAGAVKVVKESGGVITLESDNGVTFTFNVNNQDFQK